MHNIPNKKKEHKPRYQGKKGKLLHFDEDTFKILDTVAKMKGMTLKRYLELLCIAQAKYEAHLFMKKYEEKLQKKGMTDKEQ